jgi:hypothetical protein
MQPTTQHQEQATALLESQVREASANVYAHRLNLNRQREYQRQLQEANQALQQHRRNQDPAGYAAHQQWRQDQAGADYLNRY